MFGQMSLRSKLTAHASTSQKWTKTQKYNLDIINSKKIQVNPKIRDSFLPKCKTLKNLPKYQNRSQKAVSLSFIWITYITYIMSLKCYRRNFKYCLQK